MAEGRKIVYGKLVRDRIPQIIAASGQVAEVRVLAADRFFSALIAKLHEEADELGSAGPDDLLCELADVREVLAAITTMLGYTEDQVLAAAASKRSERGGFDQRLWLDEVRPASPPSRSYVGA